MYNQYYTMKFTAKLLKRSFINDVEIYPNFFSNIWKIPNKNKLLILIIWNGSQPIHLYDEIKHKLNEYEVTFVTPIEISDILKKYKPYSITYNGFNFDDPLVKYLVYNPTHKKLLENLYSIAQWSIKQDGNGEWLYKKYKYNKVFPGIDLMRVSGLDRIFKPLKQAAANLRHDKIQDLPITPGSIIKENEIVNIVIYGFNDIQITEKLLIGIPTAHSSPTIPPTAHDGFLPAIQFRYEIGKKYNSDLLNSNKSNIGKVLSANLYSEISGMQYDEFKDLRTNRKEVSYCDIILDNISFKTKELQDFFEKLKETIFNYEEYNKIPPTSNSKKKKFKVDNGLYHELNLFNNKIIFATGGIHGVHSTEKIFEETSNKILKDLDAASYYPYLYWKYGIKPEHLDYFVEFVETLIKTRIGYKREGNKVFANGLKIAINMIFGSGSDDHSWLKDEKFLLGITINGQLLLLMLAEELYMNEIYPYYFNTDGLTVYMNPNKNDVLNRIWKDWEKKTMMELEADDFSKSYIRDVNNFINIKKSGSIKLKGAFEYSGYIEKYGEFDLTGGFDKPIVAYATVMYFTKGIPIKDTIINHIHNYPEDGIYDFCVAKKANKQFTNQLFTITPDKVYVKNIQQSVRYFVSNSNNKLFKVKDKTDRELLSLVAKSSKKRNNLESIYFLSETTDAKYGDLIRYVENKGYVYKIVQGSILFKNPKEEHLHYDELEANRNITLFNDHYVAKNYNIDYNYYIHESQKLIDGIEVSKTNNKSSNNQLKLF